MKGYIRKDGTYYESESDKSNPDDVEVPIRPDWKYIWDGTQWVLDALKVKEENKQKLAQTDSGMARIGEDLIDTLIAKGLIAKTDLPLAVQNKIDERKTLRAGI